MPAVALEGAFRGPRPVASRDGIRRRTARGVAPRAPRRNPHRRRIHESPRPAAGSRRPIRDRRPPWSGRATRNERAARALETGSCVRYEGVGEGIDGSIVGRSWDLTGGSGIGVGSPEAAPRNPTDPVAAASSRPSSDLFRLEAHERPVVPIGIEDPLALLA